MHTTIMAVHSNSHGRRPITARESSQELSLGVFASFRPPLNTFFFLFFLPSSHFSGGLCQQLVALAVEQSEMDPQSSKLLDENGALAWNGLRLLLREESL